MNKEWSTRYYRSLGWSKRRIASFFEKVEQSELSKKKEIEIK
jgi:hypothetical protein